MSSIADIRARLLAKKPKEAAAPKGGLSIGCTPLNLACTGNPTFSMVKGDYCLWVGDSGSGKTFLTLTALAEAATNPSFKKHRLIFRNAEKGARMDTRNYFGALADRIEEPPSVVADPANGVIQECFYDDLDDLLTAGKPFVYLLDSMDALVPRVFIKRVKKAKAAADAGKETTGSYGTEKAKVNSDRLRTIPDRLAQTGSILIIISQTRDAIGFGAQFNPKTRGGGNALTFFATLELWTSVKGHLKGTYKGKTLETGVVCKVKVKKNRLQGKEGRIVYVPIVHGHGIDDVGAMCDWLVEWKHWKSAANEGVREVVPGKITAPEFGFTSPTAREQVIQGITTDNKVAELRQLTHRVWDEIEAAVAVQRPRRYQ